MELFQHFQIFMQKFFKKKEDVPVLTHPLRCKKSRACLILTHPLLINLMVLYEASSDLLDHQFPDGHSLAIHGDA